MKLGILSLLGAVAANFANIDDFIVKHVTFELTISENPQRMKGTVELEMERRTGSMELRLDSLVDVKYVVDKDGDRLSFQNDATSLIIKLDDTKPISLVETVVIEYLVNPELQHFDLVNREKLSNREHAFSYISSGTCKSLFPCQDSRSSFFTYGARVNVPPHLKAFMSASKFNCDGNAFYFDQHSPVNEVVLAISAAEEHHVGNLTVEEPIAPNHDDSFKKKPLELATFWCGKYRPSFDLYEALSPTQKTYFFDILLSKDFLLDSNIIIGVTNLYRPQDSWDPEIQFRWMRLVIKWRENHSYYDDVAILLQRTFIAEHCCLQVYERLLSDPRKGIRFWTLEIFGRHRNHLCPTLVVQIDRMISASRPAAL